MPDQLLSLALKLSQSDCNRFESESVGELFCNRNVTFFVELAAFDVGVFHLDAEHVFCVLFVCDAHVYVFKHVAHNSARLFTRPKFLSEIEVARHGEPVVLCRLDRFESDFRHIVGQCRRYARKVKPIRARKDVVPIEIVLARRCDCGVLS